jgi:dipeptidyl aminopeptidase/acylaminoacyl peptidase
MYEMDTVYGQWRRNARCIIATGYYPSWSPDGTKLAYSQGLSQGSVVAVLDVETGRTKLLVSPGEDPAWSPDGRYMAFVKNRWLLPPDHLSHLHMQTWTVASARETARHPAEVWVMDMASRQMRRIAEGDRPHWGHRSHRLYYYHPADNTLYSISVEDSGSRPTPVLPNCASPLPTVSPDERYVADSVYRELRILDLETKAVVATWIVPPILRDPLRVEWSPDGNELSRGTLDSRWQWGSCRNGRKGKKKA